MPRWTNGGNRKRVDPALHLCCLLVTCCVMWEQANVGAQIASAAEQQRQEEWRVYESGPVLQSDGKLVLNYVECTCKRARSGYPYRLSPMLCAAVPVVSCLARWSSRGADMAARWRFFPCISQMTYTCVLCALSVFAVVCALSGSAVQYFLQDDA